MSLTLRNKLYAALTALGIIVAGLSYEVGSLISQNEAGLDRIRGSSTTVTQSILPLVHTVMAIKLDVTQVQQYFTDVSATRALDGLDDGFKMAEESASAFAKNVAKAQTLAKDLQHPELMSILSETANAFGPYYSTGKKMAEAYVQSGPSGGNPLMEGFDVQAESLRTAAEKLQSLIDQLTAARVEEMSASTADMTAALDKQRDLGLAGLGLLVTFLAGFAVFLGRSMLAPILALGSSMRDLANGNFEVVLPGLGRRDEIGDIAAAVEQFKLKALEKARLDAELKQAEAARIAAERKQEMKRLSEQFQAAVGKVVEKVLIASSELEAMAGTMTKSSQSTRELSTAVTSTSEETSANVQGVAAASEELSATVSEISRQVHESSTMAQSAAAQATKTNERVAELSKTAERIGGVVGLITEIASQTNLLALNATIEAARAGEAGKGFSVVAQEVKALASQTARATSDIAAQVSSMQTATTEAVSSIQDISATITKLSEYTGAIAAAVEEQGAATREISRNVHEAANGTSEVASSISQVYRGASATGEASAKVLASAQSLALDSNTLKSEVEKFLTTVMAA